MENTVLTLAVLTCLGVYAFRTSKSSFERVTVQYQPLKDCPYNETPSKIEVTRGASGHLPFSTISNEPNKNFNKLLASLG